MEEYKVYVKVDKNGCISDINSSAFLTDNEGWLQIDSGYGDKYHHAQGNYFPNPITTMGGAYRYKLVNDEVVECTAEEIKEQVNTDIHRMLTVEERLHALERVNLQAYQAGHWYYRGDRVTFENEIYVCVAPDGVACVWSPSEYPVYWQK